jgi:hypothetical protein
MDDDFIPEEAILEDLKEWCQINIFPDETWDEHFEVLKAKEYGDRMEKYMELYWQDHIFPVDKYV